MRRHRPPQHQVGPRWQLLSPHPRLSQLIPRLSTAGRRCSVTQSPTAYPPPRRLLRLPILHMRRQHPSLSPFGCLPCCPWHRSRCRHRLAIQRPRQAWVAVMVELRHPHLPTAQYRHCSRRRSCPCTHSMRKRVRLGFEGGGGAAYRPSAWSGWSATWLHVCGVVSGAGSLATVWRCIVRMHAECGCGMGHSACCHNLHATGGISSVRRLLIQPHSHVAPKRHATVQAPTEAHPQYTQRRWSNQATATETARPLRRQPSLWSRHRLSQPSRIGLRSHPPALSRLAHWCALAGRGGAIQAAMTAEGPGDPC